MKVTVRLSQNFYALLMGAVVLGTSALHPAPSSQRKVAAGILPYYHDAENKPYFLLGQEPNGEWADFGGKADRGDRNSKMTAIREFSEETRCVFGMYGGMIGRSGRMNHRKVEAAYGAARDRSGGYPTCMKKSSRYIASKMGRPLVHPRGYYIMYLARVGYMPEKIFNEAPKIPHYEKKQYAWVPASSFIDSVSRSANRRATWFEGKKIRPAFVDMIKSYADEIRATVAKRVR